MRLVPLRPARLLLLAFLVALPAFARAAMPAGEEVYFAGSSFLVDASDIEKRFPLVSALVREGAPVNNGGTFDQLLRREVLASAPQHFVLANRDSTRQGDTRRGVGKSLAMAFSHESVEFQKMDDKIVSVYDIAAQVLFFDYGSDAPHMIASYPVRIRYTDLTDHLPTRAQQLDVVRDMLFSAKRDTGLLQVWMRKMVAAAPRGGERLVMVRLPVFEPKAAAQFGPDYNTAAHELAQFLEGVISDEWQVPMVPFTPGEAIGRKMVQVFANQDAVQFDLPEPSFTVGTTVRDLRKAQAAVAGGARVAYGAFITTTVNSVLRDAPLAEVRFKEVLSVTQTDLVRVSLDDKLQFNTALKSVLAQAIKQVDSKDRSWSQANSPTPDVTAQLDAIRSRILKR